MGEQPAAAIEDMGLQAVELARVEHQQLAGRDLVGLVDAVFAIFRRRAEGQRAVRPVAGGADELGEPLDEPFGEHRARPAREHEAMGIFVLQDRPRAELAAGLARRERHRAGGARLVIAGDRVVARKLPDRTTSSSMNTVTRRFGLSGLSGVPVIVRSAWSKRSSDSVAAVTCSGEPSE